MFYTRMTLYGKTLLFFAFLSVVLFIPTLSFADDASLKLQVPLQTIGTDLKLCSGSGDSMTCDGIARYLTAVFEWLIRFAIVAGALTLSLAGYAWMTARGSSQQTEKAKAMIKNTLWGVLLALGSYTLLWAVNPDLVNLRSLNLGKTIVKLELPLEPVPIDAFDSGDTDATTPDFTPPGDIHCPKSGGISEAPKILNSLKNKIAYRFGGKGGSPPYSEVKPEYMKYNSYCPPGNVCLDCSGFINYVYMCAGMPSNLGGTASIFGGSNGEAVTSANGDVVNGVPLKPGDLIGYRPGEYHTIGHVLIYMGGGLVAESAGGEPGRQPGANPKLHSITDPRIKAMMKRVRRM